MEKSRFLWPSLGTSFDWAETQVSPEKAKGAVCFLAGVGNVGSSFQIIRELDTKGKSMADASGEAGFNTRLFVAVHAGAGSHAEEKSAEYKDLCRRACVQAMCLLKKKKSAPDAVTAAVSVLEDSELSNAGRGSNLTINGGVECDAGVMEGGSSLFGAVGCVSGILNPVQVACRLLQAQHCCLSLGRVPPSVLVGTGAADWAKQQGFSCQDHHKLITDKSNRLYRKYKRKLERAERLSTTKKACTGNSCDSAASEFHNTYLNGCRGASPSPLNSNTSHLDTPDSTSWDSIRPSASKTRTQVPGMVQNTDDHSTDWDKGCGEYDMTDEEKDVAEDAADEGRSLQMDSPAQDTVGAVCVDWEGKISAAVSSGGIWLKQPGRLGPAAMYGAGCWAQNVDEGLPGVAVITSGCGEHLMRTSLAKTCADCLVSAEDSTDGLRACFSQHFLGSRVLAGVGSRLAGAVAVRLTGTQHAAPDVEVCWGHTTESMALGYMRGDGHKPKSLVSRLSKGCQPGRSFTMSSALFMHS